MDITDFLNKVNRAIVNPLILLLFGIALLVFIWGLFRFITSAESDEGREIGKKNILWGLIGMVIMISVFGIIRLIMGTFGIPATGYIF